MAELNTKVNSLSSVTQSSDQPIADEHASSSCKVVPAPTPDPPLILKASLKTLTKALQPSEMAKKHIKVHVCQPNSLSTIQLPPTLTLTRTQDRGVDSLTTTSPVIDLTDTKATAGSQTSSVEDVTYASAKERTTGTGSMFLAASEGNPCANSTRKKDNPNGDLYVQDTKGSRDNSPAASDEREVISPEQRRFTAALSEAMSKELAPLPAGHDPIQARPSVYRGSKEGIIDGWILVMRRYLQRTQAKVIPDDRAWSTICHLEGEARKYIINKAESERETPE